MATSETTGTVSGSTYNYRKDVRRLTGLGSISTGSTTLSAAVDCRNKSAAKCTVFLTATTSDHVYNIRGLTHTSSTIDSGQILATSTGGTTITISGASDSTGTLTRVCYSGLDQFFGIKVSSSGGTGATTRLDIDAELF